MTLKRLHIDFETRSVLDLPSVGVHVYAANERSDVWCAAFAADDGAIELWLPGAECPDVIRRAISEQWTIHAHNANFERVIWRHILAPRYGWPEPAPEQWRCTMVMCLASALPGKLEKAAAALSLPISKDAEGARLMKEMAQPRKPPAGEDLNGIYWHDEPEKVERLCQYCKRDVEVEREIDRRLPALTDDEQKHWQLDTVINQRGFFTDGLLLDAAHHIVTEAEAASQAEFRELTGLNSTNQTAKLIAWLGEHGCTVTDVQKGTLRHALRRKGLQPAVYRAIELRLQLAHASAGKIEALLNWRNGDGRVRGTLQFHGAATGRWTGRGPQPQNFRRDSTGIDAKIAAVMAGGAGLDSPVEVVGDIGRAMVCAPHGHRLLVGDFSGIESRVLAWISGQQSKLEQWIKFDRTGDVNDDPYVIIGRSFGHPESSARAFGKIGDLAFGFAGGVGAWQNFAPEDDASDEATIKSYRDKWRAEHPETVQFWYAVDRAAISAVQRPGTEYQAKQLKFRFEPPFLRITLPSGRSLAYPFPRIETNRFGSPCVMFKDSARGQWADCNFGQGFYGGAFVENIVSGMARDLLAGALQRLKAAGYPIVLHVHDEVVCEVPDGFGSLEEFHRLITTVPVWAEGLPLAAKVREGKRFSKPDKPAGIAASAAADEPDEMILDASDDDDEAEPDVSADRDALAASHDGDFGTADLLQAMPASADVGAPMCRMQAAIQSLRSAPPHVDISTDSELEDRHSGDSNGSGASAASIGMSRNGRAAGSNGKFHCPFHADDTPSLQVYEDHYHCFGCKRHGPLSELPAGWAEAAPAGSSTDAARTLTYAHALWDAAQPIADTLAECYLAETRHIDIAALPTTINDVLRFHPRCTFGTTPQPCLLALFRDVETDAPAGIHRIALTAEAQKIDRMMLGSWPHPRAIKLWPAAKQLCLGEGIETVLAAATKITYRDAPLRPSWAAGSSGNISKFPVVAGVARLVILIDHDANGVAQKDARICAERWKVAGRAVLLLTPRRVGADFNDLI
jgi:DNA polymerase